jgi:hypothetical protein
MSPTSGGHNLNTKTYMKTTALGILTVITAVANFSIQLLNGGSPDIAATIAAVTAGLGLINAQDSLK